VWRACLPRTCRWSPNLTGIKLSPELDPRQKEYFKTSCSCRMAIALELITPKAERAAVEGTPGNAAPAHKTPTTQHLREIRFLLTPTQKHVIAQNVYFRPSCNWRMGIPAAKVLMVPKPWWGAFAGAPGKGEPARMFPLGPPQFGWFSALKASARN